MTNYRRSFFLGQPNSTGMRIPSIDHTAEETLIHHIETLFEYLSIWRLMRVYHNFFFPIRPRPDDFMRAVAVRAAVARLNLKALAKDLDAEIEAQHHISNYVWNRVTAFFSATSPTHSTQTRALHLVLKRTKIPAILIHRALGLFVKEKPHVFDHNYPTTLSSASGMAAMKDWNRLAATLAEDMHAIASLNSAVVARLINDKRTITGLCHDDYLNALAKCKNEHFSWLSASNASRKDGSVDYRLKPKYDICFTETREPAAAQRPVPRRSRTTSSKSSAKSSRSAATSKRSSKTSSLESIKEEAEQPTSPPLVAKDSETQPVAASSMHVESPITTRFLLD